MLYPDPELSFKTKMADLPLCEQIVDLAEMARQPLVADRMVEFLKRSNALLTKVISK